MNFTSENSEKFSSQPKGRGANGVGGGVGDKIVLFIIQVGFISHVFGVD